MPKPGIVAGLKAKFEPSERERQLAETIKKRVETSAPSSQETTSLNLTQPQPQPSAKGENLAASEVPDYVEYLTVIKTEKGKEKRVLSPQESQAIKREALQQTTKEVTAKLVLSNPVQQPVNLQQESNSLAYAELLFDSSYSKWVKKLTAESTEYSQIFSQNSEKERVKSQIAILEEQKKEYLEKLNQAIEENNEVSIDACRCQLSAIETSKATKTDCLKRLEQKEEFDKAKLSLEPETHEVEWATVTVAADGTRGITFEDQSNQMEKVEEDLSKIQGDTHLKPPVVDRTKKPRNVELVEKRQPTGDKNRVQSTESTIERDDLKEQQKKETSESKKNFEAANPTTFKSRLEEFSTIWQSNSTVDASTVSAQGPEVDRSVKPGPSVNRDLKPTHRLEKSNFFSTLSSGSSSDQEEKQKEKDKKRIAFKH